MTKSDFDKIFNERLEALKALRDSKHGEYADDSETFRNLKDGGEKLGIDPMLYAFTLMTKQYNSLHDYVKEWDAHGECCQADLDRAWEKVQDVIIYNLLIYGMWVERVQDKKAVRWGFESDKAVEDENEYTLTRRKIDGGEYFYSPALGGHFQSVEAIPPTPTSPLYPLRTGVLKSEPKGKVVRGVRYDGELRIHFNPDNVDVEKIGKVIADTLNDYGFKIHEGPPKEDEPNTGVYGDSRRLQKQEGFFGFVKRCYL